jgi:DNA repair protein RecO
MRTKAIVLKITSLRESDLIVTLLTSEHGKISAVAASAKKSKRRFMGGIDLFDSGIVDLSEPSRRGSSSRDLYRLEAISERRSWSGLRSSLTKLTLASLYLEIANRICHENIQEGKLVFEYLTSALSELNLTSSHSQCFNISVLFLLNILQLEGLDPLSHPEAFDADCRLWLKSLLECEINSTTAVSKPVSKDILHRTFDEILVFSETHLGEVFYTRHEALAASQRLVNA